MEISLKNFGKIKEASVALNGLTVIAGNNDTGKSTVGKAVFSVLKAIQEYEESYDFNFRYNVLTKLQSGLKTTIRDSNNTDDALIKLAEEVNSFFKINGRTEPIYDKIKNISLNDLEGYVKRANHDKSSQTFEKFLKMSAKDKLFEQFTVISSDVFSKNLNNSVNYDDESIIQFKLKQGLVSEFNIQDDRVTKKNIFFDERIAKYTPSEITFIDSPLILEDERFDLSSTSHDLSMKIYKLRTGQKNAYETSENISTLINGKIFVDEKGAFKYQKSKEARNLEISNMASGAKIFGLLDVLNKLKLIKNDSILILDEPENHLHPEWQVKLAQLLITFVKEKEANILLTSHSPYLIEALQKYAIEYELWDKKTNFYFAKNEAANYATIKSVKDECFKDYGYESVIFKSFLKAYDLLDKEE